MTVSMPHAQAYRVYLNSSEWQERRQEALQRASYRCQRCRSVEMLEVHHLSYNRLGFERPEDLEVLCNPCHASEHGRAAKNDRVVSVEEAFERAQAAGIEVERQEDEQEKVLQAVWQQVEMPRQFRQILAELELLSHGTTANLAPTGGGESKAIYPPGEKTPPHLYWRKRWMEAVDEDARTNAWKGAKKELDSLSTRSTTEVAVETESELEKRIVRDGKGWTVDEVAQHMRCTPTFVRKARLKDGRSVVTGHKPDDDDKDESEDQREKARRLAADGLTERQIAMHTGLSKSSVRRVLGKAA